MDRQNNGERNWRENSKNKIEDFGPPIVNDKSPTYSTTDGDSKNDNVTTNKVHSQVQADFDQSGLLSHDDSNTEAKILGIMQSASASKANIENSAGHCTCEAADEVPNSDATDFEPFELSTIANVEKSLPEIKSPNFGEISNEVARQKRRIDENENRWNSKFQKLQCRVDEQEKQLGNKQTQLNAQCTQLCELRAKVDSQQGQLDDQQVQLLAKQAQIDAHQEQNQLQQNQLDRQQDLIVLMQDQIITQQIQIDVQNDRTEILQKQSKEQSKIDEHINQMEKQKILQRQQVVASDNDTIVPSSSQQSISSTGRSAVSICCLL